MSAEARSALTHAKRVLFGRAGVLAACKSLLHGAGEPRLHAVSALPAPWPQAYLPHPLDDDFGAVGFTHEEAFLGAVGEFLERHACTYHPGDELVLATGNALGAAAIGLDDFALHEDSVYAAPGCPFVPYRRDVAIHWTPVTSLRDGARRYVPACLVYIPFAPQVEADRMCLAVSSGQACHVTRTRAVLTGLCEVVERDAFMITWLRQVRLPRVDFMSDPALASKYGKHLSGCGLTFSVFDMTLDVRIPSMLCIVEGRSSRGAIFGMGAATRPSPRQAVEKALLEASQDMIWCRDLLKRRPQYRPAPDWSDVVTFEDHVRLYCEPEMRKHLAFLLDGARTVSMPREPPPEDDEQALARCAGELFRAGLEPLVADMTRGDLATAGYAVVKVLVPQMVALTAVHKFQALASPRLFAAPERAGYGALASATLNPVPHPFP